MTQKVRDTKILPLEVKNSNRKIVASYFTFCDLIQQQI